MNEGRRKCRRRRKRRKGEELENEVELKGRKEENWWNNTKIEESKEEGRQKGRMEGMKRKRKKMRMKEAKNYDTKNCSLYKFYTLDTAKTLSS